MGPFRELHLAVFADSDSDGSSMTTNLVAPSSTWPDGRNDELDFVASFVPVDESNPSHIDYVVTYTPDNGLSFSEMYGRFRGSPVAPVLLNNSPELTQNDTRLETVVRYDGATYAYLGEPGAAAGLREYTLDESTSGATSARQIHPLAALIGIEVQDDTLALGLAEIASPISTFIGRVDAGLLGSFTIDDLNPGPVYQTLAEVPVQEGETRFVGDLIAFVGVQPLNDLEFGYLFLDTDGAARGTGTVAFNGDLGDQYTRQSIDRLNFVASDDLFDTIGGSLEAVWVETHKNNDTSEQFQVLYYDRLGCLPMLVSADP